MIKTVVWSARIVFSTNFFSSNPLYLILNSHIKIFVQDSEATRAQQAPECPTCQKHQVIQQSDLEMRCITAGVTDYPAS